MDIREYLAGVKPERRVTKKSISLSSSGLLPFFQGRRLRGSAEYPSGTLFVTNDEYYQLKQAEQEGKYATSELDRVAAEMIRLRKHLESSSGSLAVVKPKKTISSVFSVKQQRAKIRTLAKENANEIVQQFIEQVLPESIRDSLTPEELELKKQELLGDLAETINNKLNWAFQDALVEPRDYPLLSLSDILY